jgi:hypothetical protein
MSVATTASILVPLAVSAGVKCIHWGIRSADKIQKLCVILPRKCGKSWLAQHLSGNEKIVIVDTDSFAEAFADDAKRRLMDCVRGDPTLHQAVAHSEYDKAMKYVKEVISSDKSKKALFLTSDVQWAMKTFKKDATFCLCPSTDFVKDLVMEDADKDALERSRSMILHKLPSECVKVYGSYEELEGILRIKFDIATAL